MVTESATGPIWSAHVAPREGGTSEGTATLGMVLHVGEGVSMLRLAPPGPGAGCDNAVISPARTHEHLLLASATYIQTGLLQDSHEPDADGSDDYV